MIIRGNGFLAGGVILCVAFVVQKVERISQLHSEITDILGVPQPLPAPQPIRSRCSPAWPARGAAAYVRERSPLLSLGIMATGITSLITTKINRWYENSY